MLVTPKLGLDLLWEAGKHLAQGLNLITAQWREGTASGDRACISSFPGSLLHQTLCASPISIKLREGQVIPS